MILSKQRGEKVQKLSVPKSIISKLKIEARSGFLSEKQMEFRCQIQYWKFLFLACANI